MKVYVPYLRFQSRVELHKTIDKFVSERQTELAGIVVYFL